MIFELWADKDGDRKIFFYDNEKNILTNESGDIIDPVSTDDLFMIMRAQYLQYGRNLPDNIPEQIAELNARVCAWSVPKILAELAMYKTYRKDIDTLPVPIDQPTYISEAGTRSKPMPQWF